VVRNGDFGSRVKLEGDIPAFIPLRNLSDDHVETAEEVVNIGAVVTAIITEVKKDHMCVDLSLKMEDFRKNQTAWARPESLPGLDEHFDRNAAVQVEQEKSKEREARLAALRLSLGGTNDEDAGEGDSKKRSGRVTRRACAHPAFRNAKNDEVDRELRESGDAMVGEALIRPSSKSSDSLAVHWVVKPGTIKVIEVLEEDKDTDASIGNVLKIKDETYGSIDELLGRYIAPMNDFVEELINHRKFLDLPEEDVEQKICKLKKANPKGVFYHVCWNELHPGYASLHFILSTTARNYPIGVTQKGFSWMGKSFSTLDKLLNEFKRNPKGQSSRSSNNSGAAPSRPPPPETKGSRWGARPAAPPMQPAGWPGQGQSLPPPPAAQASGWGAPSAAQAAPQQAWGQHSLPPPPNRFQPPPPSGQPPSFSQPPPPYGQPPPPGPPQHPPPPGGYPYQPPPPPRQQYH